MTADNAWLEFSETRQGLLCPGMVADVAVMRDDLEAMTPEEVETTGAAATICDGQVTFAL